VFLSKVNIFYHLCSLATPTVHKNYLIPRSRFTIQIAASACRCFLLFKHVHDILGTITVKYWTSPSVMSLCVLICFVLSKCSGKYFTTRISLIIVNYGRCLSYVYPFSGLTFSQLTSFVSSSIWSVRHH